MDDAQLVAALRRGEETAFAALVDRWSPAMLRIARTHVATWSAAEDTVQDTWLAVIGGLDGFEGRSSLRTWVFTILVNRARTRGTRDRRTVPWSSLSDGDDPREAGSWVDAARFRGADDPYPDHWTPSGKPVPWAETPEGSALSREAMSVLESALAALPERQQTVVRLRDVHDLTSAEVCELLDISAENQRVLLHRGRSRLRAVLEDLYRSESA
ncbi:RNA polymerase sigma factor [Spongisporangium articulatum]|uniref:RNA polymerase sigma factor n=1 Tax=Spongisporangium articulatum TaxID=3362603 RepID=A0ABW8ALT2_9ACTN